MKASNRRFILELTGIGLFMIILRILLLYPWKQISKHGEVWVLHLCLREEAGKEDVDREFQIVWLQTDFIHDSNYIVYCYYCIRIGISIIALALALAVAVALAMALSSVLVIELVVGFVLLVVLVLWLLLLLELLEFTTVSLWYA